MMPISKTEAKIINYLYKHDDQGLYAVEIARELKVAKRTTYESLDSLEQKGIVKKQTRGRMQFYTLDNKWKEVAEAAKISIAETDEAPFLERDKTVRELEQLLPLAEKAFGSPTTKKLEEALELMKKAKERR